jgi:hypothetical protein
MPGNVVARASGLAASKRRSAPQGRARGNVVQTGSVGGSGFL